MKVEKLWFENGRIYVTNDKGETLYQSLKFYPRLLVATDEQRADYECWEYGIRWDEIDEDMSYESFYYEDTKDFDSLGNRVENHSCICSMKWVMAKFLATPDSSMALPTAEFL